MPRTEYLDSANGPVEVVVLAAGSASRFGSPKALAPLEGRPLLQHVLDAIAETGLTDVVVVLGAAADDVEQAITWRSERRVRNPAPERGLASSVQVGLTAVPDDAAGALVVLGDQPRLRPDVIRAVVDAWRTSDRPIVVPRYAESGTLNPVLLGRSVFPLAFALDGDRGMGPLIHRSPDLVVEVPVAGDNPDVDTPADLERLAHPSVASLESAWADRVRANREQVDRVREVADGRDFYRPTSQLFRADPFRTDDPVLDALLALTRPTDTWLDIGAGAGRFALPIAHRVREVIALDPSPGMLAGLREGMAASSITNVRVINGWWPDDAEDLSADVALIAHVGYDIEAIGPFLGAMEASAERLCVAVMMEEPPASFAYPFWSAVHGEPRATLPALPELVKLLEARGRTVSVRRVAGEGRRWPTAEEVLMGLRQQLWVAPGGQKDRQLASMVDALPREPDGSFRLASAHRDIGIVTWAPR